MKTFVTGRRTVFKILTSNLKESDRTVWFHCASLGEFEQGVPIMEEVKSSYQDYKIVVTFFSPSGYEVKKNDPIADVITYLPLDKPNNVRRFLKIVHPSVAIFIKNEIWPNYLFELNKKRIPVILVSALFRSGQSFFKTSGGLMKRALFSFDHIFVQNEKSKELLSSIDYMNITISGDTRYDRVSKQIEQDNTLDFVEEFKQKSICIVMGSSWPEDEMVFTDYINAAPSNVKFILAPHKIDRSKIDSFRNNLNRESIIYSEMFGKDLKDFQVMIINTIGLLNKIYSYADIAYIGGGMGNSGLHNILEAATFGIPVIIGKNFKKFPEAIQLQHIGGLFSVGTSEECSEIFGKLVNDVDFRNKTGMICGHFISSNTGATKSILEYLKDLKLKNTF